MAHGATQGIVTSDETDQSEESEGSEESNVKTEAWGPESDPTGLPYIVERNSESCFPVVEQVSYYFTENKEASHFGRYQMHLSLTGSPPDWHLQSPSPLVGVLSFKWSQLVAWVTYNSEEEE